MDWHEMSSPARKGRANGRVADVYLVMGSLASLGSWKGLDNYAKGEMERKEKGRRKDSRKNRLAWKRN